MSLVLPVQPHQAPVQVAARALSQVLVLQELQRDCPDERPVTSLVLGGATLEERNVITCISRGQIALAT